MEVIERFMRLFVVDEVLGFCLLFDGDGENEFEVGWSVY